MPMFRTRRVALGATIAISALVLTGATGARAEAASFPTGLHNLAPDYAPRAYCLNQNPRGQQANLDLCYYASAQWNITLLSAVDSRGGAWVKLQDQYYGFCLDAEADSGGQPNINGDHVNSWPCDGTYQQSWYLWPIANGDWMIINGGDLNHNMVLDARTSGSWNPSVEGDPVQVWQSVGTPQQAWKVL